MSEPAGLSELQAIQVKREQLERWHKEPYFDKAVWGSVVRIAIGEYTDAAGNKVPNYQLLKIVDVVEKGAYK